MARAEWRLDFAPGEPDRFFTTDSEFVANWEQFPQKVTRSAKRRAPRKSGELRNDITHVTSRDTEGLYSDVGTNLFKGLMQETGHTAPDGTKVKPRRYLRPALRSLKRGRRSR